MKELRKSLLRKKREESAEWLAEVTTIQIQHLKEVQAIQ
jgi:hypothetical protein